MFVRIICVLGAIGLLPGTGTSQKEWATVHIGKMACELPKGYKSMQGSSASAFFYDGGTYYLTATSIPDTFPMKGNLERDYSRDFAQVVLETSRKLKGRVREYRDTVIGNQPGYISRQEINAGEGKKMYYDLLQVLHGDSIRGFSSQFFIGDQAGIEATSRFMGSVRMADDRKKSGPGIPKYGVWIGGAVGILLIGWIFLRKRMR